MTEVYFGAINLSPYAFGMIPNSAYIHAFDRLFRDIPSDIQAQLKLVVYDRYPPVYIDGLCFIPHQILTPRRTSDWESVAVLMLINRKIEISLFCYTGFWRVD